MTSSARVLVVDDEESLRHMLSIALSKDGYQVWTAKSGEEALETLRGKNKFDICLTDVRMPGMDGLTLIEEATKLEPSPTFIAMSAFGDESLAIEALRRGAFDYLSKPFEPSALSLKLRLVVERKALSEKTNAQKKRTSPQSRRDSSAKLQGISALISKAEAMQRVFKTVQKVANFPTTVLLTGETGTGKERVAGAIHAEGSRRTKAFVAVNCGAIPENLLESELFGHKKGAFTDAQKDHQGLFEVANGGTLFLDEVGELPVSLQVKLLRVLVEGEIRPVGDNQNIPVDVRVIAATSRNLSEMITAGNFREDLFYRLNVVSIHLPPLRERPEDIELLATHFCREIAARLGVAAPTIGEDALETLELYGWPGNVRELENAVERAIVLSTEAKQISREDLDERFDEKRHPVALPAAVGPAGERTLKQILTEVEKQVIEETLAENGGNRAKTASKLQISQRALLYKLKDHGLS